MFKKAICDGLYFFIYQEGERFMVCQNCGSQVMDGSTVCPNCGMMIQAPGYGQDPYGQPAQDPYAQQNAYQPQGAYGMQDQYQQPSYASQPMGGGMMNDPAAESSVRAAKTLGILAICIGTLCVPLAGWIMGGIGLGKANKAPAYLADQAKTARILNIIGLIGSTVNAVLGVVIMLAQQS